MAIRYDTLAFIIFACVTLGIFAVFAVAAAVLHKRWAPMIRRDKKKSAAVKRARGLVALYGIAALGLGFFFFTLSGFDIIPWWVCGILSVVWFLGIWAFKSSYAARLFKFFEGSRSEHERRKLTRQTIVQFVPLFFGCAMWFWFCWAVSHACVTFYPISISTKITRAATPDVCLQRDPCHIYLTVGSDLAHELILHIHSSHRYAGDLYSRMITTHEHQMTQLETTRVLYYAALSNLTANTVYYFRVIDSQPLSGFNAIFTREYSFTTAPPSGSSSQPFSFITGGDMGVSALTETLVGVAAAQNPLFVSFGGDLAYDNSIAACYRRWDDWFDMISRHFISASGLLLLSLDSNVYTEAAAQTSWIESLLSTSPQKWFSAIYHAPMWPSVRPVTDAVSTSLRNSWGPLWARYGMDVVFENHDHAYKRTKPMLASGPSTTGNGTIHVGDGNWGLDDGMRIPQLRNYNDVVSRSAFVLQVVVNDTALSARALGSNNEAFDSFTITGFDP